MVGAPSLGGRLMALLPCQRGPRRRVRTYCHPLRMTLHYGKLPTFIVGATSDDGQITGVSEFMIIRAIRYVVGEQWLPYAIWSTCAIFSGCTYTWEHPFDRTETEQDRLLYRNQVIHFRAAHEVLEASFEDSWIGLGIFPNKFVEGELLICTSSSSNSCCSAIQVIFFNPFDWWRIHYCTKLFILLECKQTRRYDCPQADSVMFQSPYLEFFFSSSYPKILGPRLLRVICADYPNWQNGILLP